MYRCIYCGKEFKTAGSKRKHEIYLHERAHEKKICRYCGKELTFNHILTHENRCKKNPDRIPTAYEQQQLEKKSQPKAVIPGYCRFCGKFCKNQNSLRNHERVCELNPNRQLTNFTDPEKHKKLLARRRGSPAWSKGLTKDTSPILAAKATRLKDKYASGELVSHQKGHLRTVEEKAKISATMKSNPNAGGRRRGSGRGKKGWYKGFYCDSTYELVYVIYNLDNDIPFSRCKREYEYRFEGEVHKYYPDFELSDGSIVEIKGYHTAKVDAKIAAVKDRPIAALYEKDLKYAFNWVKEHYQYSQLSDLYEQQIQ